MFPLKHHKGNAVGKAGKIFNGILFFAALVFFALPASGEGVYHVVQRGDTLWSVSRAYGVSFSEIRRANEALSRSDSIRPGQRIFLGSRGSIRHTVRSGDTLWGISRAYGVSLHEISRVNANLSERDFIRPGDEIIIPGRRSFPVVEPLTRQVHQILDQGAPGRWEYIVIHHSATDAGSARLFDRHHRTARGFRAMGYHFVVGNGTDNAFDGEIQTGLRWRRQWDGAHTQGHMNYVGIGICLVGNFENTRPTPRQMEALIRLTAHLAYKYGVPLENIRGHRDFASNHTRCPGRNFPWEYFRRELAARGIY